MGTASHRSVESLQARNARPRRIIRAHKVVAKKAIRAAAKYIEVGKERIYEPQQRVGDAVGQREGGHP